MHSGGRHVNPAAAHVCQGLGTEGGICGHKQPRHNHTQARALQHHEKCARVQVQHVREALVVEAIVTCFARILDVERFDYRALCKFDCYLPLRTLSQLQTVWLACGGNQEMRPTVALRAKGRTTKFKTFDRVASVPFTEPLNIRVEASENKLYHLPGHDGKHKAVHNHEHGLNCLDINLNFKDPNAVDPGIPSNMIQCMSPACSFC